MAEKCNENSRQSSRRKKCLLLSEIKNTPMQIKMKTYTYNISDSDFTQWLKIHPDCEKLILEGRIIATEHGRQIQSIEHALITQRLKAIDISGLDAAEFVQCCEMVNYDGDDEYDWDESDGPPQATVTAAIFCTEAASIYAWRNDAGPVVIFNHVEEGRQWVFVHADDTSTDADIVAAAEAEVPGITSCLDKSEAAWNKSKRWIPIGALDEGAVDYIIGLINNN